MITVQPKALQGINSRPNPETTNSISELQRKVGGSVCAYSAGAYEYMISTCGCIFTIVHFLFTHVCVFFSFCMSVLAGVIVFLLHVCVSVNIEPHSLSIP